MTVGELRTKLESLSDDLKIIVQVHEAMSMEDYEGEDLEISDVVQQDKSSVSLFVFV